MIKIEMYILDGELDIEIKKNNDQYDLLVILSKSDYFKEKGRAWNGKTIENQKIMEIANLIKEVHNNPSVAKRITINDGILIKINLKEDELDIKLIFKDIGNEMIEFELIQKIFEFINQLIQNETLRKYTQLFGYSK